MTADASLVGSCGSRQIPEFVSVTSFHKSLWTSALATTGLPLAMISYTLEGIE